MDTALRTALLLALTLLLIPSGPARADHNRDTSVGLFLMEGNRLRCDDVELPDCEDGPPVTGELFTGYYAILCVFNGEAEHGIAGLQCAIDYDGGSGSGVEIDRWVRCASYEYPKDGWPAPGTYNGNTIAWESEFACQKDEPGGPGEGVTAVAGFFYLTAYSADRLSVIEWSGESGRALKVATCGSSEAIIPTDRAGSIGFSDDESEKGNLPCQTTPREDTTWGQIKSFYDNR